MDLTPCQPTTVILVVAAAGIIYHLLAGMYSGVIWWTLTGLGGAAVFQLLCIGGLAPIAWVIMAIPLLLICFFLAVALFTSQLRIKNVREVECPHKSRCRRCGGCGRQSKRPCKCHLADE